MTMNQTQQAVCDGWPPNERRGVTYCPWRFFVVFIAQIRHVQSAGLTHDAHQKCALGYAQNPQAKHHNSHADTGN